MLKILTAPSSILRKKTATVNSVDDSIRELMDNMLEIMYQSNGVGLAANQVGIDKRILVLDLQGSDSEEREDGFYPLFMANPEILESSKETAAEFEGCLSLPEQKISVVRPCFVKVKYLDYHNQERLLTAGGWLARAIQHEIDHLEGILLIDYLSPLKKDMVIRKLRKIAC